MTRGKISGLSLSNRDASIVLAMQKRGDREHDIAAWFGVNQGRIAEVKGGSHGPLQSADDKDLPPSGPPGVKGRRLRGSIGKALELLQANGANGLAEAIAILQDAQKRYDTHEA
jgi:hypothetical protein